MILQKQSEMKGTYRLDSYMQEISKASSLYVLNLMTIGCTVFDWHSKDALYQRVQPLKSLRDGLRLRLCKWFSCTIYETHKLSNLVKFSLKLSLTVLYIYLKIILLQYFQLLIFNFQ